MEREPEILHYVRISAACFAFSGKRTGRCWAYSSSRLVEFRECGKLRFNACNGFTLSECHCRCKVTWCFTIFCAFSTSHLLYSLLLESPDKQFNRIQRLVSNMEFQNTSDRCAGDSGSSASGKRSAQCFNHAKSEMDSSGQYFPLQAQCVG